MAEAAGAQAPEVIEVSETEVACDGGGVLGHPRVFLNMGDRRQVECPYCDRIFKLKDGVKAGAAH